MSDTRNLNLVSLVEQFHSEDACREYLEKLRWPDGVECPRCGYDSISEIRDRNQFECNAESCRYQFSVTAGTIFHDTKLPLWKWFAGIYLICEAKKGISASQLGRTLGVSYKTAWYLCHRIRNAMNDDSVRPLLRGVIQIDETYVGGESRYGTKARSRAHMACVVGAVSDDGIELKVVKGRDRESLHKFIRENTNPDDRLIVTDSWQAYRKFGKKSEHVRVNKSKGLRTIDGFHTQDIESVWSLLKRSIMGSYHSVSVKHLDAYLDELEWRFNNRKNPFLFRDTILRMVASDGLKYSELTA